MKGIKKARNCTESDSQRSVSRSEWTARYSHSVPESIYHPPQGRVLPVVARGADRRKMEGLDSLYSGGY